MKCVKCGMKLSDNTNYCPKCGNKIVSPKVLFCMKCGAKLKENANFCEACGAKVDYSNTKFNNENIYKSNKKADDSIPTVEYHAPNTKEKTDQNNIRKILNASSNLINEEDKEKISNEIEKIKSTTKNEWNKAINSAFSSDNNDNDTKFTKIICIGSAVVVVIVLFALMLSQCGGNSSNNNATPNKIVTTELNSETGKSKKETPKKKPESTEAKKENDATENKSDTSGEANSEISAVNLTVDNCVELANMLSNPADMDDSYSQFATKYKGRNIEFDGRIDNCAKHANYDTRFDYLVSAGDYDPNTMVGPYFQFENVGYYDLHTDLDTVSVGLNVHIIAQVESYDSSTGIFKLKPISVTER